MPGTGRAEVDFGATYTQEATLAITGQTTIPANALTEVIVEAKATTDHTVAEHVHFAPKMTAGNVVAGVGFTIYGSAASVGGKSKGKWSVIWVWKEP